MLYYTSDLHLGHNNAIKFDKRPFSSVEEMDKQLIDNWNSRVTNNDEVHIVGDFIYRSGKSPEWYLNQLKGKKILIIGNHEKAILQDKSLFKYFESIEKMMHVTDGRNQICLCHFPIIEWNGYFKGHYHIFGHIHNSRNRSYEVMREEPRALNAGCMINQYMPVTFDELVVNNRIYKGKSEDDIQAVPRRKA